MPSPQNPLRALHEKAGARLAEFFGCPIPESFSDFAQEYEAAREAVALLDTNYHMFIFLAGPDRVRFLNAIASSDIKSLAEGHGALGLLLNPQGHILAELESYALADRLLNVSHAMARESTVQWLDKYIIMDDVTLDDATERLGSVALEGPKAAALLHEACGRKLEAMQELSHREALVGAVNCRIIRRSHFGQLGVELIAEREALPALWQTLLDAVRRVGGAPVGYATLNALRLEGGIPWFGYDFDDKQIPHEAALETTHISFTKGCYTGQEIVERVRSRGHVNRRRVGLEFSSATAPPAGTKLLADGKEAGHVTSAAFSPARQRPIGMGYLRREHSSPGSQLQWDGGTAIVIDLSPAGARVPAR